MRWSLDDLYISVKSDRFMNDMACYEKKIKELILFCRENFSSCTDSENVIEEFLNKYNELKEYSRLSMYVNLSLCTDTSDSELMRANDKINDIETELAEIDVLLKKYLKAFENFENFLSSACSDVIKEHTFFLEIMRKKANHMLCEKEEILLSKLKNTGSLLWQKQWEQLSSTLEAEILYNGKTEKTPLSVVRSYAYSSDSGLRKAAYDAEILSYKKIEKGAAFSINGIKGEVITECKMRGYKSPLSMTIEDARLKENTINAMFEAIDEKLPIFEKYFLKKSEILGYVSALPFYEIFAPIGEAELKFSYDNAKKLIAECFGEFSEELKNFAENAFNSRWIDVLPHSGKVGGAFSEDIHSIRQSRILINFTGTFNDVVTIAHELGHAFHSSRLYKESEINSFYPMPIAETASTFCETLVFNSVMKKTDKKTRLAVLENSISGSAQTIVDIYSRFIFEKYVFERPKNGSLSAEELCEIMLSAQSKTYGKGLDSKFRHPYMWVCKPHYYDSEFNYYNFPYAFGMLLAKGLYALYLKDKASFVPTYDKFLGSTGKMCLEDVAKIIGINLEDKNFWLSGLAEIENEINKFLAEV